MADGTAQKCGRVGSCHIHLKKPFRNERLFCFLECQIPDIRYWILDAGYWILDISMLISIIFFVVAEGVHIFAFDPPAADKPLMADCCTIPKL